MRRCTSDTRLRTALIDRLEPVFNRLGEALISCWPRRRPAPRRLRRCRLISHRGVYDNRRIWENTIAAFDAAVAAGAWGIECDVRWSLDREAVVFHDADFRRLAGVPVRVEALTAAEIRARWPHIPLLRELAERYGKRVHLMVELKAEAFEVPEMLRRRLAASFDGLAPGRDYHLLSLSPWVLDRIGHAQDAACLPIARERVTAFSRLAAGGRFAGLCGHYLLMTSRVVRRHHRSGQGVGTGFSNSASALYREINRGVDWIFTDQIQAMSAVCRGSALC